MFLKTLRSSKLSGTLWTGIVVAFTFCLFPLESSARQYNYRLTNPVPGIVERGAIQPGLSSYAAQFCMFQSSDGKMHFLAPFTGPNATWYMVHINMTDGTANMATGNGQGTARYVYDPVHNKVHTAAQYGQGYWNMYDVATGTVTQLYGPCPAINCLGMGSDGMIWGATSLVGGPVMGYDPVNQVFNPNFATSDSNAQYVQEIYGDANYVYCICRGLTSQQGFYLQVIERANPANKQIFEYNIANQMAHVWPGVDGNTYYWHRAADGSTATYALPPVGSVLTQVSNPPASSNGQSNCAYDSAANYNTWQNKYHWEVNVDHYLPLQGSQEYSQIQFRTPVGSGSWTTAQAPYNGPWGESTEIAVIGSNPGKVISVGNYLVEYDYLKDVRSVKGQTLISTYGAMKHDPTGEIYINGYSKATLRYDPTKAWTLVPSKLIPYSSTDPNRPNPYLIATVDSGHYHFGSDYDANGLVWIASNYTRTGTDYGVLVWYNPADGTSGTVSALENILDPGAIKLRAIVATNKRSKICVSGADSKIYVIDAATKTLENVWTLTPNLFDAMIEIADDHLMVVQASIDDASGTVSRVTRMRVSTGEILFDHPINVAGWAFGAKSANSVYRYAWRLLKGGDKYGWMFVGDHLYRIHPSTGNFTKIADLPYGKLAFNGPDLGVYGCDGAAPEKRTHFFYFPQILGLIDLSGVYKLLLGTG